MNTQDLSPLGRTGCISLQSKGLTLKSLLQHHSSKASILRRSAFFTVQLSHPYMTTGKTIALTRWTFVGKVMSLLLNMLSRLVITFLARSKRLLISWLQAPSAVILEPKKIKSDTVSTVSGVPYLQNLIKLHKLRIFYGLQGRLSWPRPIYRFSEIPIKIQWCFSQNQNK